MQAVNPNQDSLNLYLERIRKIPSLSHVEVLHLARRVQWMMQLQLLRAELGKQLSQDPTFVQWSQQVQLSEAALTSALHEGKCARQKLIEAHLLLVAGIARYYQNRGVDLLDLIQEGTIGLSRAVEKFNPDKGYRLSTYARWWIRREISRVISTREMENSSIVRGDLIENLELLESKTPLPEETIAQLQQVELVRHLVNQLPERKRQVLVLLYGLKNRKHRSLNQVAEELGLTPEQVRWARDTGLQILKNGVSNNSAPGLIKLELKFAREKFQN